MLLRKQDLDPHIAERLPSTAIEVATPWPYYLLPVLMVVSVGAIIVFGRSSNALAIIWIASSVLALCIFIAASRMINHGVTVHSDGLRQFAKTNRQLDVVEREYCRTVATLAESTAVTEDAARELLGDLNRLLGAHRTLMAQELPKNMRAAREEAAAETFRELRASLKRAGKLVTEPIQSPTAIAEEAVDETISRVRLQARSLEQATEEVQQLRH